MDLAEIQRLAAGGESATVEFKKSTAELTRAAETLCGFLNTQGGVVLIGVAPNGRVLGQHVSDATIREIVVALARFEPPGHVEIDRVAVGDDREVIVLRAKQTPEQQPFVFHGKPFQRVGTTTSIMPQARYHELLLHRVHETRRWENASATGVEVDSLDHEEILRTVRLGIEVGRLPESTGAKIADTLDRLGLRKDGGLLNAAVVLFGRRFLPDYPQPRQRRRSRVAPSPRRKRNPKPWPVDPETGGDPWGGGGAVRGGVQRRVGVAGGCTFTSTSSSFSSPRRPWRPRAWRGARSS